MTPLQIILDILGNTPWWIWILYGLLLLESLRTFLKPSVRSLATIFILPTLCLAIAVQALIQQGITIYTGGVWIVALSLGMFSGQLFKLKKGIAADKINHLISLPKNPITAMVFMEIFFAQWFFIFFKLHDQDELISFVFPLIYLYMIALGTGLSIGFTARLLYTYKQAPHSTLK